MAFRWLTCCRSCGKDFIDVNFVQEINEEEKLFMSKAYVQLATLIKNPVISSECYCISILFCLVLQV